jgi:DNA-directed RNA polymerase subunit K/omega
MNSVVLEDHPEVRPVFRNQVAEAVKEARITQPYFTKYEYTALIAARAQQLSEGAKPLVTLEGLKMSDPMFVWNVAKREVEQRVASPFIILRQMPNNRSEIWGVQELEVMW